MNQDLQLLEYVYINNNADKTLFLLHGTGGDKDDFLFLNDSLSDRYNLVGVKGNVNEDGMTRFFKRLSFGVFDMDNIDVETNKMEKFIAAWIDVHKITSDKITFLGYSNGANMILATIFNYPYLIKNAILLHPMLPFKVTEGSLDLSGHKILVTVGASDQMISREQSMNVIDTLKTCKAEVMCKEYQAGHEITSEEIKDIIQYLNED